MPPSPPHPAVDQPVLTRAAKRALEAASPRPSPTRRSKRVREATPVAIDDYSVPADISAIHVGSHDSQDDSEIIAGPSTRREPKVVEVNNTSEAESVLFSEKTVLLADECVIVNVDYHNDDQESLFNTEGEQGTDGEYYLVENTEPDTQRDTPIRGDQLISIPENATSTQGGSAAPFDKLSVDRSLMPPPPNSVLPRKTRSTSLHDPFSAPAESSKPDRMSRVIERQKKRSFVDLAGDTSAEEDTIDPEGDEFEESYHSGDSEEYEMDHRPVLQRTAIKKDIRDFTASLETLREDMTYTVVDRLGEGTFSSVYLAHDCRHEQYHNEYWLGLPDTDPYRSERREVRVALKKILATSSAVRIENELAILENLRGCRNVSQLVTAFREEDQVIIVLPYHQSDDFRHFYKHMDPPHIRSYMRDLFRSLKDIHKRGIIHRDVKPANFLYDYESGHGVLVDFGLAERYVPPVEPTCQHAPATPTSLQGSKIKTSETATVEQALYDARKRSKLGEGRVGFPHEDKRPAIRTNRAGTRGFRAPEVLFKCPDQTVAVDVWSAGVVLFSILTHKFPAFNSSDDIEALMEIAAIYGKTAMERCALLHNRTMISNVPSLDAHPSSLSELTLKLNPHLYTPHPTNPTPEEAQEHINNIDNVLDLLSNLLRLDSTKRLTAHQALRHPFFHNEDGECEEEEEEEVEV